MNARKLLTIIFVSSLLLILSSASIAQEKKVLDIKHWTTSKGTRVYYVSAPELPMVDIITAFYAGSARDGKKPGLASFTSQMLKQGAGNLSADQIAEGIENLGANISTGASKDTATVNLRTLTDPKLFQPALSIYKKVLNQPTFPNSSFKREQKRLIAAIKEEQQQPGSIAGKAFYKALYGKHPYGHPAIGTIKSTQKMRRKNLREFYKKYYVAKNAVIVIVGAIKLEQAKNISEEITSGLNDSINVDPVPAAPKFSTAKIKKIHYPSSQTHILIGQIGITQKDPDYFILKLGNGVLGGIPMVSKLFDEVREKRGLSYSVRSSFQTMVAKGPFVISLETRTDQVNEALDVVNKVLKDFLSSGPTNQELNAAKKNIIGAFPLYFSSNRGIAGNVLNIAINNLPLNYLDTYIGNIRSVSAKQIHQAFQKHIDLNKLVTINVGKQLEKQQSTDHRG